MNSNDLQSVMSKMDSFIFKYTDKESVIDGYITGKSISDGKERCVTFFSLNPKDTAVADIILSNPSSLLERTIIMDYRLLNTNMINVLKKAYQNGIIGGIRILPDDYKLEKEVYDALNTKELYGFLVATHSLSEEIKGVSSYLDIRPQEGLCQIEHIIFEENQEEKDHYNIHITRKLSKEELHTLAKKIKQHNYQKIIVDFYEPTYYKKMLETLKEENLPNTIVYSFLANPLYDETTCYEGLDDIVENNVEIHYNTCNDLNEMTREEPHTEGARYYSDIEASGITDSENYAEMVKMLDSIVEYMEEKDYSPLEKIAYLQDYFKKNFIYDPDYQTTSHDENANLDKVFRKDRMICEGFSNLYSAILRRAGVLCFTYGTDDHQKNMVRITDPKYGVDSLALIDPTFDLSKEDNHNVFENFLVPIDNDLYAHQTGYRGEAVPTPEVINIPTSLSMATEYYETYINDSNPVYATSPIGYAIRMLELMGLGSPDAEMTTTERVEYYKSALARSELTKKIPHNVIAKAVHTVREKEHEYGDEYESTIDQDEITENLAKRGFEHNCKPHIKLFDSSKVEVETYTPSLEVDFIKRKPQPMVYTRPRKQKENESNEEFSRYLEEFYDTMFYRRYEETSDMNNNEQTLEEFDIVEKDNEVIPEIVIYRDMDDSSRTFVTEEVLRRFHIGEPEYKIVLDKKTVIYEIKPQEAAYIIDHANNKYAPYTIRFQNFDFNNELDDTMKEASPEEQEKAPDEIMIFRDVDDSGRAFVTKSTLDRFQIPVPSNKVFLGHMMVYEIDPVQAINIISNCNNPYAPYMIRYVSIKIDKPLEKEEPVVEEENRVDEIMIFRDVDDSGRAFVTKSVLDRFHIPVPSNKVHLGRMMVYEINPADAIAIVDNCNNQDSPYTIRYVAIKIDNPLEKEEQVVEEENKLEEIMIFRDVDDSGRAFVTKSTLERFQIPVPSNKVHLGRMMVYEINPADAIGIIDNCNNPYAPYAIRYIAIQFDEKEKEVEQTPEVPQEEPVVDDNLIPGTNYKKPRPRRPYETDDHYVAYLEGYYDSIFGNEEDLFTPKKETRQEDNLIPGTNYEKPRIRGNYETDEEYVDYLRDYYNSIFGTEGQDLVTGKGLIQPRARREGESEESYVDYLAMFYGTPANGEETNTRRK